MPNNLTAAPGGSSSGSKQEQQQQQQQQLAPIYIDLEAKSNSDSLDNLFR